MASDCRKDPADGMPGFWSGQMRWGAIGIRLGEVGIGRGSIFDIFVCLT